MDRLGQKIEIPDPIPDAASGNEETFVLLPDFVLKRTHLVELSKPGFDHAQASGEKVSVERKHDEVVDTEFENFDQSVRFSLRDQSKDRTQLRAVGGMEIRNELGRTLLTKMPVDDREIRHISTCCIPGRPGVPVDGW